MGGADTVILDVRDVVSAQEKAAARAAVSYYVLTRRVLVRVSGWACPGQPNVNGGDATVADAPGQAVSDTEAAACLSNCLARSSPEWTIWLCIERRAASASRARRFSSISR
jgi:hypothetical protein